MSSKKDDCSSELLQQTSEQTLPVWKQELVRKKNSSQVRYQLYQLMKLGINFLN